DRSAGRPQRDRAGRPALQRRRLRPARRRHPNRRRRGAGVKIGVGSAVITPDAMPVHLAGFGEPQVAHEVRDDLEVRAVYVANDDVAVCLLVCDLLGMSHHFADPVRAAVGAALGLERAAVLTSCVHTHAGPSTMAGTEVIGWPTPDGYGALLVERCVDAATQAKAAAVDDV